MATATACALVLTPSLLKIEVRWKLTVDGEIDRIPATSLLALPSDTTRSTVRSRSVSRAVGRTRDGGAIAVASDDICSCSIEVIRSTVSVKDMAVPSRYAAP